MKRLAPLRPRYTANNRGVALVLTLSLIVLLTIAVVAFFSHATADRSIEASRGNQVEARLLGASAQSHAVSRILKEVWDTARDSEGGDFAPSRPEQVVPERLIAPAIPGTDPDFANLIRQSVPGADPSASDHSTDSPAANGRRVDAERWNQPVLLGGDGFASGSELPRWIYVTPDGMSSVPSDRAIGRFAYNVYDIGGLLNANAAGFRPGIDSSEVEGSLPGADLSALDANLDLAALADQRNPAYGSSATAFRDYARASSRNGFLSPVATQLAPPQSFTSNYFVSRQDLLRYARVRNPTLAQRALPYLTHFSRSVNAPSRDLAGSAPVRFPSGGTRTIIHYTDDGDRADYEVAGEAPILQRRFSLAKLKWLTPRGPRAGISEEAINYCFGLRWNSGEERWDYTGYGGTTLASAVKTLAEVAPEGREPDFFETLKAGIVSGSVGVAASERTLAGQASAPLESSSDHQLLRIGANIIDCADADNYPTRVASDFEGLEVEVAGVEDLPYFSSVLLASLRDGATNPGGVRIDQTDLVLVPKFFNPHRVPPAGLAEDGPERLTADVYSGAISEVQVGQQSEQMSMAGVNKDLVTGDTISISEGDFETFRPRPTVARSGGSSLGQHVPWVTSDADVQVFPLFSYEDDAPTPPPYQTLSTRTQRTYFSEDLGIRLRFETPGNRLKTYATISGNEAIGGSGVVGYAGVNGVTMQFDSGPPFSKFKIFGFTGGESHNSWHNITLWDPRTNRLGPSQGYYAGISSTPPVAAGSSDDYMRRGLPARTADGAVANYAGGLNGETLLGLWPEGGKSAANGQTTKTLMNTTDPDGVYRPADAWLGPEANPFRDLNAGQRRPVVLQRPFRTVAELGYVFRDVPWKTLSFFDETSGDAGLLDLFSVSDEAALTDARVALNTRQPVVLQALLQAVGRYADGGDRLPVDVSGEIAQEIFNNAFLNGEAAATIPQNVADLARLLTPNRLPSLAEVIKWRREAVVRALAGSTQTRTWSLLVDTVAQVGSFPQGAGTDAGDFLVEAEERLWVSVAIDRFTGTVVAMQKETVDE